MIARRMIARRMLMGLLFAAAFAGPTLSVHAAAAAKSRAPSPDPEAVLSTIYTEAVHDGRSGWFDADQRRKYVSKSLFALWAKADAKKPPYGDEGPINFDLTMDTNALALESFVIRVEKQGPDSATLSVDLGYQKPYVDPEGPRSVTYDFVRENGRWLIDNCRTKRWSVRNNLSLWLKE
jgi:hypothetical protein